MSIIGDSGVSGTSTPVSEHANQQGPPHALTFSDYSAIGTRTPRSAATSAARS
jgi:hypothetical protein